MYFLFILVLVVKTFFLFNHWVSRNKVFDSENGVKDSYVKV